MAFNLLPIDEQYSALRGNLKARDRFGREGERSRWRDQCQAGVSVFALPSVVLSRVLLILIFCSEHFTCLWSAVQQGKV